MVFDVYAHAKINIGLAVGKKRPDGYHPIRSYFARLDLADEIHIEINECDSTTILIESDVPYLEDGHMDIMEKCARHYLEHLNRSASIYIKIKKNIPFKAGLGGGSSDGAAVMNVLNEFFGNTLEEDEMIALGSECGSDIPFFLSNCSFAYVIGRGECIKKIPKPDGFDFILWAMPEDEVSTTGAYRKLDSLNYEFVHLPERPFYRINKKDYPNDFERVCDNPLLNELEYIYKDKAYVSLSGSGSSVFVLSSSDELEELLKIAPEGMNIAKIL